MSESTIPMKGRPFAARLSPSPARSTEASVTVEESQETIAERHLRAEVAIAKRRLLATKVGSIVTGVLALSLLGGGTAYLRHRLEPANAAATTQMVLQNALEKRSADLADELAARIPTLVASVPDYAKQQLPRVREQWERKIDNDIVRYLNEHRTDLDAALNQALADNRAGIVAALQSGQVSSVGSAIGADMEAKVVQRMATLSVDGESLQTMLDETASPLTDLRLRLDRLSANRGLDQSDTRTRRALAALLASRAP